MGDFNWSSPTAVGAEVQWTQENQLYFATQDGGIAMRIRPGAVTPAAVHRWYPSVPSTNPGIGIEIVDTLIPTPVISTYFPATDVTTTSWTDESGATASLALKVDDKANTADYIKNGSAIQTWEQRELAFRGTAAALSGKRISGVIVGNSHQMVAYQNPLPWGMLYEAFLNIGGTKYYSPKQLIKNDGKITTNMAGIWIYNPATNLPWTQAQINNIFATGGTDSWGFRYSTPAPYFIGAGSLRIFGVWGDILNAPENRVGGYYYSGNKQLDGWNRFALTSPAALSANTYYWVVEYPLYGGTGNFNRGSTHIDPGVAIAASASASTGEHRGLLHTRHRYTAVEAVFPDYRTQSTAAVTLPESGRFTPMLLEQAASAINTQSDPYCAIDRLKIAADSTANIGQWITSAAATTYGAVRMPVTFTNPRVSPDQPLVVELRDGAGSETGGGNLRATATLWPGDIDGTKLQTVQIPFAASYLSVLSTKYFLLIKSACSTYASWDISRYDTRSNEIDAASGTTVAMVQGATQGGTTDQYSAGGTADNRYDIPISLIAGPTVPGGFSVSVLAAV